MKRMKNALKIATIIPLILFLVSCNNRIGDSEESHTVLILSKITGKTAAGDAADFVQSDVLEINQTTGQYYVVADVALVSVSARLKEPQLVEPGASYMHNAMLTHYVVSYELPNGGGTPGVDVPYSFSGALSNLIEVDTTVDISFVIVQASAKNELPLFILQGTANALQTTARVDFYGEDLAKHPVQVTGYISIFFADYIEQ